MSRVTVIYIGALELLRVSHRTSVLADRSTSCTALTVSSITTLGITPVVIHGGILSICKSLVILFSVQLIIV